MNCEQARELAALAASGDVAPAERNGLEFHTASCAECRAEVDRYEALCGQLAMMRNEPMPDHVYAAVRGRVFGEVGTKRRLWPAFAAVLACSLILLITLRREAPVRVQTVEHSLTQVQDEAPEVAAPPTHQRVPKAASKVTTPEPSEPLVVKMFTDDPDVVIYWIADAKSQKSYKEIMQ